MWRKIILFYDADSVVDVENSNVAIQSCIFQHSLYPAVRVTPFLETKLTLNHCKFVNNIHHKYHGAAILVQFNYVTYNAPATAVAINNCNFSYNGDTKSLVYITSGAKLELINTSFHDNQNVSIYVLKSNLHINRQVIFENNIAENGTGIYISENSTLTFGKIQM